MKKSLVSKTMAAVVLAGALCLAASANAQPKHDVLCDGPYVLCDHATCQPIPKQSDRQGSPSVQPDTAICECTLENGKNLGPGPCAQRSGPEKGQFLSTYSFKNASKYSYMTCTGSHTTCYGYPCLYDEKTGKVRCTCPIYYEEQFVTYGGDCDTQNCTAELWQGGTVSDSRNLNDKLAAALGLPEPPTKECVAPKQ
jgi:hypothetical protein